MKRSVTPFVITAAVLAFFYLPIVVLVVNSFNASRFGGEWNGFTLQWYRKLLASPDIWHALGNTFTIAVLATVGSTVLGTTAAFALDRYRSRLQDAHYLLVYAPLVIPEILLGISLLLFFVALGVELSYVTIVLAHVTFCVSYVAMVVLGRLQDFDWSLVEAAQDLGASPWVAARDVVLPLLAPGIAAGALLAFTLSVDDFVITFFTAGPGTTTLPLRIYSMIKHGSPPLINALSTLLLALTTTTVWLSQRLLKEAR
ncbi:MAG: ABC transporter permease [Candidatus Eisenbacteria bacterium]|uniref:ABC transporter permease n=1 Tax=Eiseniibacteriota bacterium TaxID=2212470 RepID=A0A933W9U9_UNCEI|nr:ABC transporter permease [Candidatus Eisenbacteria bacterium]